MGQDPIFIGGLDRSGKTLLRLALSSHPNIAITRRTHMWTDFYNRYGDLGNSDNFERCLQAMLKKKAIIILSPDVKRIKKEFFQGELSYGRLFGLFHQHFAERHGRKRWGEQETLIERYAAPIFQAYPNAKVIHMIRDPRTQYGETLQATKVKLRLGKVGSACSIWRYSAELAEQNKLSYSNHYKVLTFEYLMTDPEHVLRDVCDFLGEDFDPAMLTFTGTLRFSAGKDADPLPSYGWAERRVHKNLSESAALTPREIKFIEIYARKQITENGYQVSDTTLPFLSQFLYYCELPFNIARSSMSQKVKFNDKD